MRRSYGAARRQGCLRSHSYRLLIIRMISFQRHTALIEVALQMIA